MLDPLKIQTFEDISEKDREYLESTLGVGQNDFGQISVDLSVDNFRPQTMLKAVLPSGEVEGKKCHKSANSYIIGDKGSSKNDVTEVGGEVYVSITKRWGLGG